jgi:hypothetical protein
MAYSLLIICHLDFAQEGKKLSPLRKLAAGSCSLRLQRLHLRSQYAKNFREHKKVCQCRREAHASPVLYWDRLQHVSPKASGLSVTHSYQFEKRNPFPAYRFKEEILARQRLRALEYIQVSPLVI